MTVNLATRISMPVDSNCTATNVAATRISALFRRAMELQASDVHLRIGQPPIFRIAGQLVTFDQGEFETVDRSLVSGFVEIYLTDEQKRQLESKGSVDGALAANENTRLRFNLFRSGGGHSVALRLLQNRFYELEELGLSNQLYDFCQQNDGLILVAGPTGSGKSTTLASLINHINQNQAAHVITIEDPIEFTHQRKKALINQRQIGIDTADFYQALLDALRQDPDVILVGEIRDLNTIRTAIMAAETGHLVLASVHASDCTSAIERLISVFPGDQQQNIQHLLSTTLRAVIAQHLMVAQQPNPALAHRDPRNSRNRVLASEVLKVNHAVSNLISNGSFNQIRSVMETNAGDGMYTLDRSLAGLLRRRQIGEAAAKTVARNPAILRELARKI